MPKIREHEPNDIGYCVHCGAAPFAKVQEWFRANSKPVPEADLRECVWREKATRPEPKRREYAYEDAVTISARMVEIRREEEPKCPRNNDTLLHSCLRSIASCPSDCVLKADWIGPQG